MLVLEVGDVALGRFGQVVELLPGRSLVHPIAVRGLVGVDHTVVSAHLIEQMAQRLALQGYPEVVLLVNVHQLFPERFQLRHAGLGVVHEHP